MAENGVLFLAVGVSVGLLALLALLTFYLCRRKRRGRGRGGRYLELPSTTVPTVPAPGPAPPLLLLGSPCSWTTGGEIPFTLPPRLTTQRRDGEKEEEEQEEEEQEGGMKVEEAHGDILAHRGSLTLRSWFPVGRVLAGLYPGPPLGEVVAPPPGMATRLCFSVEYRRGAEQLTVTLFRLGNLPPRFHGNVTLVELRLLPDDRRPRQAKARGTGPDPEFNHHFIFQVSGVCVSQSVLSVCVLSVEQDAKRHAVGRVLLPLEGELGQAGRVLWRDLETEDNTQCSDLGDVQISLSYSPTLQRLSVVVAKARGLQPLSDAGVCVQVSLQIHTQVVKVKRSCAVTPGGGGGSLLINHRMSFKVRAAQLDEACLSVQLQQPRPDPTEPPVVLGAVVLGPFMFAKGPQLQHWMDMVNSPQEVVKLWHGLSRAS